MQQLSEYLHNWNEECRQTKMNKLLKILDV